MVVPLGPGKFYGRSLPRPRIYTDVKFNTERVDPPVSVVDPLLSWAHEAHWSMGGLSTKRLRLQGRIEGNITKLRAENEKLAWKKDRASPVKHFNEARRSASPPPAPEAARRKRRYVALIEEPEAEEDEETRVSERKRLATKLINEFNSVAAATRTSSRSRSSGDLQRSRGGSFASRMQKASENLKENKIKKYTPTVESESSVEVKSKANSKLHKREGDESRGSPSSRVRTSPRLMKKQPKT
uniref:Uncharacterized protein n=1 Tax=Kalanchoe fedtschenkoi TaxID=63787 RepID=A0A7N0UF55_KALFE